MRRREGADEDAEDRARASGGVTNAHSKETIRRLETCGYQDRMTGEWVAAPFMGAPVQDGLGRRGRRPELH